MYLTVLNDAKGKQNMSLKNSDQSIFPSFTIQIVEIVLKKTSIHQMHFSFCLECKHNELRNFKRDKKQAEEKTSLLSMI